MENYLQDYQSTNRIHPSLLVFTPSERRELLDSPYWLLIAFYKQRETKNTVIETKSLGGMLPKQAYDQFNKLHLEEFGYELPEEECIITANNFLELFKVLVKDKKDTVDMIPTH